MGVIRSFNHKQLQALWESGVSRIDQRLHDRILRRLDRLDAAVTPEDMNLPGFNFHRLQGFAPPRFTVHVNGPWCLTFGFKDGEVLAIDLEQYH
jgi:proteic killer suppression protein